MQPVMRPCKRPFRTDGPGPVPTFSADPEAPMAVPKRKTSPSKRGMRRSHDRLPGSTYVEDKETGELRRPHHVDPKTGLYRGKQILTVKDED